MIFRLIVAGICMVALKACGGGGSNSSDPIPPNTPPTFDQSLYTLSVVEGGSAIGVVAATDAEADNLVYSVSGEDAESLVISGTGSLSFRRQRITSVLMTTMRTINTALLLLPLTVC
jgi:hypothetical protein